MPRSVDADALRVGRVLRAVREQQGLTQAEVAAALGKGEGAYAAYENGRSRFTVPELSDMARALKVTTPHLTTRLGFCGDVGADIASILVERFGRFGETLVRLDRILAQMQADDGAALDVLVRRIVEPYEHRREN